MNDTDHLYLTLLTQVLRYGEPRMDRTGVGTRALFGEHVTVSRDVTREFPLVSVKKTHFRSVALELLWFLRGETNTETLGCGIWDQWSGEDGELGPIYGAQWRGWCSPRFDEDGSCEAIHEVDQIARLVTGLKDNPTSRRHIVSAWNVAELDEMALVPCHYSFQCFVAAGRYLDMQVNQRSCDLGLGAPFNWASYALLMLMLAKETGLYARRLKFAYGDMHVYDNHAEKLRRMLEDTAGVVSAPCTVALAEEKRIPLLTPDSGQWYTLGDIELQGYEPGPFIKLEVAV